MPGWRLVPGYVFHKVGVATDSGTVYRTQPKKDEFSHGVDAV